MARTSWPTMDWPISWDTTLIKLTFSINRLKRVLCDSWHHPFGTTFLKFGQTIIGKHGEIRLTIHSSVYDRNRRRKNIAQQCHWQMQMWIFSQTITNSLLIDGLIEIGRGILPKIEVTALNVIVTDPEFWYKMFMICSRCLFVYLTILKMLSLLNNWHQSSITSERLCSQIKFHYH